jgi:hypothetical protein
MEKSEYVHLLATSPWKEMQNHFDSIPPVDMSVSKQLDINTNDWHDGHVFQVAKTVLSNWTKGVAYDIPFGTGHASSNFGYRPMYSVSFTGVLDL